MFGQARVVVRPIFSAVLSAVLIIGAAIAGLGGLGGLAPGLGQAALASEVSPAAREKAFDAMAAHFQGLVDGGQMEGVEIAILQGGETVHRSLHGTARETSVYRIYSMTKPIVSVAIMMLAEAGKLDLDAPVAAYLPEFADPEVFTGVDEAGNMQTRPAARDITVRDLLRHTSGLSYGLFTDTPVDRMYREAGLLTSPDATLADLVTALGDIPLLLDPGSRWIYSLSTDVLGRVVEVVSGQSLDVFFDERIFTPLGMDDTAFYVQGPAADNLVRVTRPDPETGKLVEAPSSELGTSFTAKPTLFSGGSGLVSTTDDYLTFLRFMMGGGKLGDVTLLTPESVKAMTKDQLPDAVYAVSDGLSPGIGFGLGFAVITDGEKNSLKAAEGTYFWGGYANTVFWVDPSNDMAVLLMTNMVGLPSDFFRKMLHSFINPAVGRSAPPPPAEEAPAAE